MQALELDNVAMAFGSRVLFEGLSARVKAGHTVVVTGANGSGKSTLLKIVAGLARPEAGIVRIVGKTGARVEAATERRHYLGYAAPDVQLYGELTGDENVLFFARLRGTAIDVSELLTRVGLSRGRGSDRVSEYSSGMRHRLKLAVSLIGSPSLLIWDEPTATLDPDGAKIVDALLAAHGRAGGIAVVATNDPAEAERWGDVRIHVGR